jgi:hypothetical protein
MTTGRLCAGFSADRKPGSARLQIVNMTPATIADFVLIRSPRSKSFMLDREYDGSLEAQAPSRTAVR